MTGKGRDLELGQCSNLCSHTYQSQEPCPPRPLLPPRHLIFSSLSWVPGTEGEAPAPWGLQRLGWGAGLYGAERQDRQGAPQTLQAFQVEDEAVRRYLMSSPEQPSTGKSIPFSTFRAERLLFIMSHTSSVLLGMRWFSGHGPGLNLCSG